MKEKLELLLAELNEAIKLADTKPDVATAKIQGITIKVAILQLQIALEEQI